MLDAIEDMLSDDAFSDTDLQRVDAAVKTARELKEWLSVNRAEAIYFQEQILKHMRKCFGPSGSLDSVVKRENVWGRYHHLRISPEYVDFWKTLLRLVGPGTTCDPILFQHISNHIFKVLIVKTFPLPDHSNPNEFVALTFEEANALRYVAGYVCVKLYKSLKKSSAPNSSDLCAGIGDMIEDDDNDDVTSAWVKAVDRGGLFKVNDRVYAFFLSMEYVARDFFRLKRATDIQAGVLSDLIARAVQDESIELNWAAIGVELAEEDKKSLLRMMIKEFITLRGFSFAGSYVEVYKQSIMQSLQKKRALRSKLNDSKKKKEKRPRELLLLLTLNNNCIIILLHYY